MRLLKRSEAAERLDRSVSTLDQARTGKGPLAALPYIRWNGFIRYREEDIDRFLSEHTVVPNAAGNEPTEPEAA